MFSRLVRRLHMYLALFLFPWMLMYALSTMAMNHRDLFADAPPATYEKERELIYDGVVPDAPLRLASTMLLESLRMNGVHTVVRRDDGAMVITRNSVVTPRRLIYTPADRRLVIERMPARSNVILERFHRRRGYATGYAMDTLWAASVDLVIGAMLIWALSGLWMWWGMKATRATGLLSAAAGAGLFVLYLLKL